MEQAMTKQWIVHIAELQDGRYYTGITQQNVELLSQEFRQNRHSKFTRCMKVKRVLWSEPHSSREEAHVREVQIKGWTHAKTEALVAGDWERLKALSKCSMSPRGLPSRP